MILLDANILLFAYNARAPEHLAVRTWLENLLKSSETIAVSWPTLSAFARVSTNVRLFPEPVSAPQVFAAIRDWLGTSEIQLIHPGPRHLDILERLVTANGAVGPLVSDAVHAALAIEHGATLASTDLDFSRFEGLKWINPLRNKKPAGL